MHTSARPAWHSCPNHVDRLTLSLHHLLAGPPKVGKSWLSLATAVAAAEGSTMHAYIVVSLLTGARTEELRALRWDHVDLTGDAHASPPLPPYVAVWRSVRASGDTKTRKSRRTLATRTG
ncbi:hypothetical protein ACIBQX_46855 [Nonomuraea sp. NPDC049714]|uniref:hypothetical protein n=1 Tax=Nonomuraea sp. NPDC049714 TaxID=3364357 RepID=UPI0037A7707F